MKKTVAFLFLFLAGYCFGSAPQPGWVTKAKVVEVYDGDTVTVEIKKRIRVRLLDCWAPEIRGGTTLLRRSGYESRDYLKSLIDQKEVILSIPAHETIGKSFSFDRALGLIYINDQSVSDLMVKAGYATKEKQ